MSTPFLPQTKEYIDDLLITHFDVTEAILKSHIFTEDTATEMQAAEDNLKKALGKLTYIFTFADVIELLKSKIDDPDFDANELLDFIELDRDDLKNMALEKHLFCVEVDSMEDQDKLTDFINSEIYPYRIGGKSAY